MPPGVAALHSSSAMATEDATEGKRAAMSEHESAVKLQKVYRSYRTRRRLADSAVLAKELWWQAIEFARLNHNTISFFNYPETAQSRWNRASSNAAKIGKGATGSDKAVKLAFQHWIEAIDPRHRYGHNLHIYYQKWTESTDGQPFFYWLDLGEGKNVDLEACSRAVLREQCIAYLGPQERESYEYVPREGKLFHKQTEEPLDTNAGPKNGKWIFVMSTSKRLYAGQKKKGRFHHSSFLAGGSTLAAGRLVAEDGVLKAIWAYSGHYRPTQENLGSFLGFLKENQVPVDDDQIRSCVCEDYDYPKLAAEEAELTAAEVPAAAAPAPPRLKLPGGGGAIVAPLRVDYKRTFSGGFLAGGIPSPRAAPLPRSAILKRLNSKNKEAAGSYQLGHQISLKWSTGAGARIGCIADYPSEVRDQALEILHLSPRCSSSSPFLSTADTAS